MLGLDKDLGKKLGLGPGFFKLWIKKFNLKKKRKTQNIKLAKFFILVFIILLGCITNNKKTQDHLETGPSKFGRTFKESGLYLNDVGLGLGFKKPDLSPQIIIPSF